MVFYELSKDHPEIKDRFLASAAIVADSYNADKLAYMAGEQLPDLIIAVLTAGASAAVKGVKNGKAGLGLLEKMQDLGTMSGHLIGNERGSTRIFGDIADGIVPNSKNLQSIATPAHNSANGIKLNNQLLAEEVAQGHAYNRHVLGDANGVNEFVEFGVKTQDDFAKFIESVVSNPTEVRVTNQANPRYFILDEKTITVVVKQTGTGESSAFRPDFLDGWDEYLLDLPKTTAPFHVVQ